MIHPFIMVSIVLAFLIMLYLLFSSKKFEAKVFRVDSDNITWTLLGITLFVLGIIGVINTNWMNVIVFYEPPRATGYIIGMSLFFIGAYASLRKAKKIAEQKVKG